MHTEDGGGVKLEKPYFVCVEAKRRQTLMDNSPKAQILAQIRALQINGFSPSQSSTNERDESSCCGALTDGYKWSFWHNHNNGWYFLALQTGNEKDAIATDVLCT
jgi:hypothetical protein